MQSEWALAARSQTVVFGKSAGSPFYLVTLLADRGRWTMILCQLRNGSCVVSQVGVAELLMFVYILLEKEA